MKIKKSDVPQKSLLNTYLPADYSDSYEYICQLADYVTPDDRQVEFWTWKPRWLKVLFRLRDWSVRPFGLKTGVPDCGLLENCIRNGGWNSMISEVDKSPDETVLRMDDKHLQVYMSVYVEKIEDSCKKVRIMTVVHFRNRIGYIYFYTILPLHKIIVRKMSSRVLRKYSCS